ncbi:hypothetical protein BRC94_13045 [Halobacteriales archaeon QS_5_70_17]|nr:MAG: hypothetical protein BRC94_13045 [Halobacteriales archaeon QS_5_70_17]
MPTVRARVAEPDRSRQVAVGLRPDDRARRDPELQRHRPFPLAAASRYLTNSDPSVFTSHSMSTAKSV